MIIIITVDFALAADHGVKMKESEKIDKYLDFARELKKMWNTMVTVIPIVVIALETVTKDLGKDCRNWKSEEEFRP